MHPIHRSDPPNFQGSPSVLTFHRGLPLRRTECHFDFWHPEVLNTHPNSYARTPIHAMNTNRPPTHAQSARPGARVARSRGHDSPTPHGDACIVCHSVIAHVHANTSRTRCVRARVHTIEFVHVLVHEYHIRGAKRGMIRRCRYVRRTSFECTTYRRLRDTHTRSQAERSRACTGTLHTHPNSNACIYEVHTHSICINHSSFTHSLAHSHTHHRHTDTHTERRTDYCTHRQSRGATAHECTHVKEHLHT